ncbi:PIN domain-containing protein [Desulfonauticus submarinus]
MRYLLDTCIIAELVKPKPNNNVVNWLRLQDENQLYLSVLTLGEISKGIEKVKDEFRKKRLHLWIEDDLRRRFRGRILPINEQVAMIWGQIQGRAEKQGRGMPVIDGLIAATGLAFNLIVVSRNVADMEVSGVVLFNPWDL